MYTNTSSIATNLLQEKVDRLDRDKNELLSHPMPIRNNFVHNSNNYNNYNVNNNNNRIEKSEIKEMHEFSMNNQPIHSQYPPSFVNKPSFVSIPESHAQNGDARVEYLEAFNYELSLQLKQLMMDKNTLEEKV